MSDGAMKLKAEYIPDRAVVSHQMELWTEF